jgi:hypothetical protein
MISDISELEMCSNLKRLKLKDNHIEDDDSLFYISNLPLVYLNLSHNPIHGKENYKELIQMYLPNLESLDTDNSEDETGIEGLNSTYTSSTVNHSKPTLCSETLKTGLVDEKSLKPITGRGKCNGTEHISPVAKKDRIADLDLDLAKSLNGNKELKPVIIKKTMDISDIIAKVENNHKELAQQVLSNIDKHHATKANILQNIIIENPEIAKTYTAYKVMI